MINAFRVISILEGLSYLAILSITIGLLSRDYAFHIGMTHGVLFMLYLVVSMMVSHKQNWSLKVFLPVFFASVVPLAFVGVELYLNKSLADDDSMIAPT